MRKSFFRDKYFNLLFFSSVFFMMSFTTPLAELTDYIELFSSKSWIGVVIAMFTAGALLSRFFSGRMADRIGRVPVMMIGTLVTAISGCLYVFTTTMGLLLLLRFFHGLSTGWRPVGTTAYLSDIIPTNRRGEALGFLGIAGSTGSAIGPWVGSFIKEEYSFELMFVVASLFGVVALLLTALLPESLENPEKFKWKFLKLSDGDLVAKSAYPALIAITLDTYSFGTILTVSPDFVSELGYSYKGGFLLVIVLSSIVSRFFSGKAADKMNKVKLLQAGILLSVLSLVLMGFSHSFEMITLAGVIYGISIGVTRPTIFAWTADLAVKGKLALALSTMLIGLELGIFLGAFVSGLIFNGDISRIYLSYWIAAGVSLSAAVYLRGKRSLA
jgi:MFS family permease